MKAIILARVSTEEQREAGNSLPAQVSRIEKYCESKGFEVIKTFSFDESAYKAKRDEFDKIIDYLKKDKDKIAVCFDKVDRLSRNVFDKRVTILYEKACGDEIELHFVSDGQIINSSMSAIAKFQFGMSLGLAKYYSDAISDNVKRTFEKMRAEGRWTGKAPVGYKNVEGPKGDRDIVLDEERADLVRKMFELYATGNHSILSIKDKIDLLGLKNTNGNYLTKSNVDMVLRNSFYHGIAYSKKYDTSYPHKYEKLISKDLFYKCQEVRLDRARKPSKVDSSQFIFKGLLSCENCGCTVTPEAKTKKSGKRFVYYSCTNSKGICKRYYVSEKDLLEQILSVLERMESITEETQSFLLKELRRNNEAEVDFHKKQLARINTEYQSIQNKISRLTDLLLESSITKETYEDKLQELKIKQHKLTIEIDLHTKADKNYLMTVSKVFSLATRAKKIFESSEIHEKRQLINYLIQNPTLNGKKLGFTIASPYNLVLDLATNPVWLPKLDEFRTLNWVEIDRAFESVGY